MGTDLLPYSEGYYIELFMFVVDVIIIIALLGQILTIMTHKKIDSLMNPTHSSVQSKKIIIYCLLAVLAVALITSKMLYTPQPAVTRIGTQPSPSPIGTITFKNKEDLPTIDGTIAYGIHNDDNDDVVVFNLADKTSRIEKLKGSRIKTISDEGNYIGIAVGKVTDVSHPYEIRRLDDQKLIYTQKESYEGPNSPHFSLFSNGRYMITDNGVEGIDAIIDLKTSVITKPPTSFRMPTNDDETLMALTIPEADGDPFTAHKSVIGFVTFDDAGAHVKRPYQYSPTQSDNFICWNKDQAFFSRSYYKTADRNDFDEQRSETYLYDPISGASTLFCTDAACDFASIKATCDANNNTLIYDKDHVDVAMLTKNKFPKKWQKNMYYISPSLDERWMLFQATGESDYLEQIYLYNTQTKTTYLIGEGFDPVWKMPLLYKN